MRKTYVNTIKEKLKINQLSKKLNKKPKDSNIKLKKKINKSQQASCRAAIKDQVKNGH